MLFQKNSDPKKLSIREIWNLYRNLRYGLQGQSQEYLMDELIQMLEGISVEEFKSALRIMYGEMELPTSPIELSLLFTRGVKENNLFSFSDFIKVIGGSTKRQSRSSQI